MQGTKHDECPDVSILERSRLQLNIKFWHKPNLSNFNSLKNIMQNGGYFFNYHVGRQFVIYFIWVCVTIDQTVWCRHGALHLYSGGEWFKSRLS